MDQNKNLNHPASEGQDRPSRGDALTEKIEQAEQALLSTEADADTRIFALPTESEETITVDDIESMLARHYEKEQAAPQSHPAEPPKARPAANGYVRPTRPASYKAAAPRRETAANPTAGQTAASDGAVPTMSSVYHNRSGYTPSNGYRGEARTQKNGYIRPAARPVTAKAPTGQTLGRTAKPVNPAATPNAAQTPAAKPAQTPVTKPAAAPAAKPAAAPTAKPTANTAANTPTGPRQPSAVFSGIHPQDRAAPVSEQNTASAAPAAPKPAASSGKTPARRTAVKTASGANAGANARATAKAASEKNRSNNRSSITARRAREAEEEGREHTALSSVVKAVLYIAVICLVSVVAATVIIKVGNDVFAFIKPSGEYDLTIDEGEGLSEVAKLLDENNIIDYPGMFKLYAKLRKRDTGFVAGTCTVSPSMNYDELLAAFKGRVIDREQVSITIPEGYTAEEIIRLLVDGYGIGTREGYQRAINQYDYGYWFTDELPDDPDRLWRLEGYLFPDTYYFFTDSSEETVIDKLLTNFANKFDESFRDRCTDLGMTVDEVVTLASMIQAEGKYASEYSAISSVFHNRLANPAAETAGRLESDATVKYVLGPDADGVTPDDLKIEDPYNTYLNRGLPPGAIGNPSLDAITYALYPATTDYYYFVSRKNGYSLFARTSTEHAANIAAIVAENADGGDGADAE